MYDIHAMFIYFSWAPNKSPTVDKQNKQIIRDYRLNHPDLNMTHKISNVSVEL